MVHKTATTAIRCTPQILTDLFPGGALNRQQLVCTKHVVWQCKGLADKGCKSRLVEHARDDCKRGHKGTTGQGMCLQARGSLMEGMCDPREHTNASSVHICMQCCCHTMSADVT